jgi:hypothetical protein
MKERNLYLNYFSLVFVSSSQNYNINKEKWLRFNLINDELRTKIRKT